MAADTELLAPRQVAAMYGVTIKTIRLWADAGKIPSVRTAGGHRRYPAAAFPAEMLPAPPVFMPRASRLRPEPARPGQYLVARVGWRHDSIDPGLFLVAPDMTWEVFGATIAGAVFPDPDHLFQFYIGDGGKPRRSMWENGREWVPRYFTRATQVLCDEYQDERFWDWEKDYDEPDRYGTVRLDGRTAKVADLVGHHWSGWYNFDFGDEHWLSVSFHASLPFPPGTDPVLIAPTGLTDDEQYPR